MEFNTATTPRGIQNLHFNPDRFPHATLEAFNGFINNTSFGTKPNISNLPNTQLKFVLQNGLQQQRKNMHLQILNL